MVHLEHDRKRSGADEASNHKLSAFNVHHAVHTAHEDHQVHKTVDEAHYDHDGPTYEAHDTYKVVQIYRVHRMGLAGLEPAGGLHC